MSTFAKGTEVPAERTRVQLEKMLRVAGATSVVVGWQVLAVEIGFEAKGRRLRFTLTIPTRKDRKITHDARGWVRSQTQQTRVLDAEERRLWRALLLVIRAKLEAVESGIETFDQAFLANIVVPGPDGVTTVGEYVAPAPASAYARGAAMPPLLGAGGAP